MLLTGNFSRSLDEKLRLAIPKRLRDALDCPVGGTLFVAPGADISLAIYPEASLARLAERLAQASPARQDVCAYMRLFYAQAQGVELDGQGRVRISAGAFPIGEVGEGRCAARGSGSPRTLGHPAVANVRGGETSPLRRNCRKRLRPK